MEKLRLGGMALSNGVLVHGPTSWGAAVRASDGSIRTAFGTKRRFAANVTTLRDVLLAALAEVPAERTCDCAAAPAGNVPIPPTD